MHPAYSIIIFSAASGAGYGLLFVLSLGRALRIVPQDWTLGAVSLTAGLALVIAGLLSSTLHLGRPERAWRALSQWRSSWLSREGLAALIGFIPILALVWSWLADGASGTLVYLSSVLTAFFAFLTVFCTGKIYASLTTIRQWHHPYVVPIYLAMALASGATLFNFIAHFVGYGTILYGFFAMAAVGSAVLMKLSYWLAIDQDRGAHTIEAATGLGAAGSVSQWEAAHTAENFIMKEMGYTVGRKHASRLRNIVAMSLVVGLIALTGAALSDGLPALALSAWAVTSVGLGILVERWLFFAEAQHVSSLYYGAKRA